jgi:hypothetical protein
MRVPSLLTLTVALVATGISSALAQTPGSGGSDTVLVAGEIYEAGGFHRWLLGDNYRDAWTAPIKVPVLDLKTFHGGLTPTKIGGGMQAKSLRFVAPDSSEYVFRQVRKTNLVLTDQYRHTVIWYIVRDEGSASHPVGAIAAAPILDAVGVLHPTPNLYFMPDDPILGEFRKDFAGILGMVEEYPSAPKKGRAFADADNVIDSEELLAKIDSSAKDQVDARTLLTARLVDLLVGDNDRHPDNWRWARLTKGGEWEPVPRDRDKVFVSYEGAMMSIVRFMVPSLVTFSNKYPDASALFANAGEFDRRMLGSLDQAVWDSVATSLMQTLTDQKIDDAVGAMPPEYAASSRAIAAKLTARRNGLRVAADRYYRELWHFAEIHGSDADDEATVTRLANGMVDVRIQSGNNAPYYLRRFEPKETAEIRIYLHGGNDRATVQGSVPRSIKVRIIGGNGTNTFTDLSTVGGKRNPTLFYEAGTVQNVKYAKDTVDERKNIDNAFNHRFNRRPWVHAYGGLIPPITDRGADITPIASIHSQRGLGIYPVIGLSRHVYGFRSVPYSSLMAADFAYATGSGRIRVRTALDKRFEGSDVHVPVTAIVSQFEVVQFKGFGNDVPDLRGRFFDVRQRQWQLFPAIGRSFSPVSDIIIGPIVRYTTTDSLTNRFLTTLHPYGFNTFGEVGVRLRMHLDSRYYADTLKPRFIFDVSGSGYPGMWDVTSPYQSAEAVAAALFTLPLGNKPVLGFRAGGKKLWGSFPYFDAAFLGGSETIRTEERQRFAGDASLYGTTELRVPIAKFPFILPIDLGAIGFMDAGKVFVNGDAPGGWHSAVGAGLWFGYLNPGTNVNILFTNNHQSRIASSFGFAF